MADETPWSQYAKGVQKLGAKTESAKQTPEQEGLPHAPNLPPRAGPAVSLDTMPAEWRQKIEGTAPTVTPEPPPLPEPPAPRQTEKPPTPVREVLDPRIEKNISLGEVMIEARLDLHGKTESDAHEALSTFIESQRKRGRRMLLVITGKGRDGLSVLRTNLPRWCDVPPLDQHILAVRTAAQHHGGEGAYYILLRKKNT
jgi:DNA-nicking Smr family endonuclease